MDQVNSLWAKIQELLTSRTIWGVVVMLFGMVGINVTGFNDVLAQFGDHFVALIGAALAVIGYWNRRPTADQAAAVALAKLPAR